MLDYIHSIDLKILESIGTVFQNSFLDWLMPIITKLGDLGIVWIVLSLIFMITKRHRKTGLLMAIALITGLLLGEGILKHLIMRERPFLGFPLKLLLVTPPSTFSFPSGHTTSSFAVATIIFLRNKKWGIFAYILAILIAFSRLYLFLHYPTDILGGIILGVASAITIYFIFNKRFKEFT